MGLLSRFGRGLTQAAPIMGQMAQASLLAGADEKKYDRLVKAQEATRKEARDVADISWGRQVGAAETKATAALTSARRAEKIKMLSDGLSLTASLQEVQERSLASYKDQLSDPLLMGAGRIAVQGLFDAAEKRLVDTIRRQNEISAMYQKYVDPKGEIPWADTSAEKDILTDLAIMNAASIAKDEIMGAEAMATEEFDIDTDMLTDIQRATNLEKKDSIIEAQIKIIDDSISGRADPLNKKQRKLFKDTVESYIVDRSYLLPGDQPRTEIQPSPEGVETTQELRPMTPEDLIVIRDLQQQAMGGVSPVMISDWGPFREWLAKAGAWTVENLGRVPFAAVKDWLKSLDRRMLEEMGIDPDATPEGFEGSAMRSDDKPNVEDSIAMIFNMSQRV